jgi:hypothetical protein
MVVCAIAQTGTFGISHVPRRWVGYQPRPSRQPKTGEVDESQGVGKVKANGGVTQNPAASDVDVANDETTLQVKV